MHPLRRPRFGRTVWLAVGLALAGASCREDLGQPDYGDRVVARPDGGAELVEPLPGTDPYIPGKRRLAIGIFYEGGASRRFGLASEKACAADPGSKRCYFIFQVEGRLEYDQSTSDDRVEGVLSDRLRLTGTPFWGGGVLWGKATDLSEWTTLAVALKSSDPSFARVTVEMQSGATGEPARAVTLNASDYGYTNDGRWHVLRIPVADFVAAGLDPSKVRAPFLLGGMGSMEGDALLVDEVYFSQD